jgi:hypothetical protein
MIKLIRVIWAGHVEKRNVYNIFGLEPDGKRLLGRRRHKWVDNIKMKLREIEWASMN